MIWGVFDKPDGVHIIPCDDKGYPLQPHIPDVFCSCLPELVVSEGTDRLIINHYMEN